MMQTALEFDVAAVILETPFTNIKEMAAILFPIPLGPLLHHEFDNLEKIKSLDKPLMIIHGTEDDIVPFDHGRRLFDAAKTRKTSYWIDGADRLNQVTDLAFNYQRCCSYSAHSCVGLTSLI